MKWVQINNGYSSEPVFARIDDDGCIRVTCSAEHPEFVAWLAEGNTPEEWSPNGNQ